MREPATTIPSAPTGPLIRDPAERPTIRPGEPEPQPVVDPPYDGLLPEIDRIRIFDGNDQDAPHSSPDVVENAYAILNGPRPDSALPWAWTIDTGGGDDVIEIRDGSRGIVRSGPGHDVYLVREGYGGSLNFSDFDIERDRIVVVGTPTEVATSFTPIDTRITIDFDDLPGVPYRFVTGHPVHEMEARGALLTARPRDIDLPDVRGDLVDIGDDLSAPLRIALTAQYDPEPTDGDDFVEASGSTSLLDGADVAIVTGRDGGFVSTGGTSGRPPSRIISPYTFDNIYVDEGTAARSDGAADVVLVTPEARGNWTVSLRDPADRLAFVNFGGIGTLEDLQTRALGHDGPLAGYVSYALTDDLTVTTRARAGQIVLDTDAVLVDPNENGDGRIVGGPARDALAGAGGNDTVVGLGDTDRLLGEGGRDRLKGGAGDDHLLGGRGNDRLDGQGGADRLEGGPGRDLLVGGPGPDTAFYGDAGRPVVVSLADGGRRGEARGDTFRSVENVAGGRGDDRLDGDAGANLLSGGAGDDRIDGGRGDDTVAGGPGTDLLFGGPGADTFLFENPQDLSGRPRRADTIRDLDGRDAIDLSGIDADATTPTVDDPFAWRGLAPFTGTPGEMRWDRRTERVEMDRDGDGASDLFLLVEVPRGIPDLIL